MITRMVDEDKDRLIFTNGKNQANYWNEPGLEQFYDVILKKEVNEVLKGIDKDAVEMVDGDFTQERFGYDNEDADARRHISIKNTKKIRDFLGGVGGKPKGFGIYGAAPVAVGVGGLLNTDNNAGN